MRKCFCKVLSILLVLTLIVSAVPISVSAASSTHSHPVCGSSCNCDSESHYSDNWVAWDGTTKMYNGDYYLTKDIVLDSTIILDYSYTSRLCLNGHSITCEDTVFDIYSYRNLLITDCKGTGKVETTNSLRTISNNNGLSVWGGKIVNSLNNFNACAVMAWSDTSTYVCGGRVECAYDATAISYQLPGCDIKILGGEVYGGRSAISGWASGTSMYGSVEISGGKVSKKDNYNGGTISLMHPVFKMSGGYVEGEINVYETEVTLSGGTIDGGLINWDADSSTNITGPIVINGGEHFHVGELSLGLNGTADISAGTFKKDCQFNGPVTISAGNFSDCENVRISDSGWIYGGYYDNVWVEGDGTLYLSGVPEINVLHIEKSNSVSAQNIDQSGSYAGDTINVSLENTESGSVWEDGDVVIKNVKSDAVAEKFVIDGEDSRWTYLERVGNNLVLRILPHGKWGDNVTWGFKDGELTISGTGTIDYTISGYHYPWGDYRHEITKIVVEPGIVSIPSYTFEFCEKAETIILPETLTDIKFNAFKNCRSLNNLLLPSSLISLGDRGNSYHSTFNACDSLSDVYFLGTEEEWNAVVNSNICYNLHRETKKHFLEYHETTATCTEPGVQGYYQFDDTSVYGGYYDENKKPITKLQEVPALGHRVVRKQDIDENPIIIKNVSTFPFVLENGTYYSYAKNLKEGLNSDISIITKYDCTLTLNCGISTYNYANATVDVDIKHNGSRVTTISGNKNKVLTLDLSAGDVVDLSHRYGSYIYNSDKCWVSIDCEPVTVSVDTDIPADTIEADCTNGVVCDYCQTVVKEAKGHRVIDEQVIQADPVTVENLSSKPFTNTNGTYYSTNTSNSSSSQIKITADYACTLKLNYGVSSESGYDKLIILHNNTQKDSISGAVSNKTMTLNLNAGDIVTVSYSKDGSVSKNQDRGWVTLVYDQITVTESTDVPVEELNLKCDETVECDYCNTVIAGSSGHVSDEWIYDTLPSIYDTGIKHKVCDECGEIFDTDTVAEKIIPDINGDGKINSMDALIILKMSVGNEVNISDEATLRTDVNGDGKVNSMDALIVLNIAVGKIKLED